MISPLKYFKTHPCWSWIIGFFAFLWVLLRSGTNPKRLTYPCQQAAMPVAVSWLLAIMAFFAGSLFLRRFAKLSGLAILMVGAIWFIGTFSEHTKAGVNSLESLPVWEVPNPISTVFVMDSIPLTTGSLAAGDTTVPDEYLPDPAIDTLLMTMAARDIYLHKTASHPDGIVGSDNVVVLKGNFQSTSRNTTSTQHPDGFSGEILICDNTQEIGTGINQSDNNSEDPNQSIPDVVNTFYTKGYPVYYLDWNYISSAVANEYSTGEYNDGYVYENSTKISYPKFRSPSQNYYISLRYGIWDSLVDFPVLKAHSMAGSTIAVKNWIGVLTTAFATERYGGFQSMHYQYFFGSYALVARVMAVTYPKFVILDAAWTSIRDPNVLDVVKTDMLLASTDPVAVSWYAAKYILTPIAINPNNTDPDRLGSRYRNNLEAWKNYLQNVGFSCTKDSSEMSVYDRGVLTQTWIKDNPKEGVVKNFNLYQNYPNPFNPETTIEYQIRTRAFVTIIIYNLLGQEVKKLINEIQTPGNKLITWDGRDNQGGMVGSGIYIYSIRTGTKIEARKMVRLP
jgi:hypothetical protein